MAIINCANICRKHGSMLVDFSLMFINEVIIKVLAEIGMWGVEMWTQGTVRATCKLRGDGL